jgi:hypothetical protein
MVKRERGKKEGGQETGCSGNRENIFLFNVFWAIKGKTTSLPAKQRKN